VAATALPNLCLEPGNRWNPMIDAISTYINGCELDQVSILDMDAYEDTNINWRARRGYGALIAAYGASCPLALNCAVSLIDHSGKRLRIETSVGTLTAGKVIVTVPTNLIADQAIRFHPALPEKLDAARGLPLGLADKVVLALDDAEALPKEGNLRGATMRTEMGTYHLRPFGQPCIEGFFGGRFAQALEDAGEGAIAAAGIDEIVSFLGNDFRRKLKPLKESRWSHDPFARGSYSHALPGTPATVRCWPHRWMDDCSLRARRPRRGFSPPRTGQGIAERGRPKEVIAANHEALTNDLVIASEAKQSIRTTKE